MTTTSYIRLWSMGLLLIVSALVFVACGDDLSPEEVQFDLVVEHEAIDLDPPVMKVNQGDRVTLTIDSDKMGSVHLHGYDFKAEIGPSETAILAFTADATGNFPITFHAEVEPHGQVKEKHEGETSDNEGTEHGEDGSHGEEEGEVTLGSLEVHP